MIDFYALAFLDKRETFDFGGFKLFYFYFSVKPSELLNKSDLDQNSKDGQSTSSPGDKTPMTSTPSQSQSNGQYRPFPSGSELNGRLRRLIASYQRESKREESRLAAQDRRNERRERIEQVIWEREQQKLDVVNKKLNRKKENDFYWAYGIEHSKDGKKIVCDRFKALAR